ncbi:MAG: hypothetical protein H5T78_20290 [Nocardia sp.]|nr:hypothetical protein [Nocardia sp.]
MTRADMLPVLPSGEMLAALLAGRPVLAHRHPQIVDAVQELTRLHRAHRAALADLGLEGLTETALRQAATAVVTAAADIEATVAVIDAVVAARLHADHPDTVPTPFVAPHCPVHTETVGAILSRAALLAGEIHDHGGGREHLPAVAALDSLLAGYAHLRGELMAGRLRVPATS